MIIDELKKHIEETLEYTSKEDLGVAETEIELRNALNYVAIQLGEWLELRELRFRNQNIMDEQRAVDILTKEILETQFILTGVQEKPKEKNHKELNALEGALQVAVEKLESGED